MLSNYQRHRAGIAAGLCAKPSLAAAKGVFFENTKLIQKNARLFFRHPRKKALGGADREHPQKKAPCVFSETAPNQHYFSALICGKTAERFSPGAGF